MNKKAIKESFSALEVSKPLQLKKSAPAFKEPKPAVQSNSGNWDDEPSTENQGISNVTQGSLTPGELPQVNLPHRKLPQEELPLDETCAAGAEEFLHSIDQLNKSRQKQRRARQVREALSSMSDLSPNAQKLLLDKNFEEGYGKLAHPITRLLKAPGRNKLKLVDIALILTVFDKTHALVSGPKAFAPLTADEFKRETGMDESNVRVALRDLVQREILLKIKVGTVNFWGINPYYFKRKKEDDLTQDKKTRGNLPQGNSPGDKKGDLPQRPPGQITTTSNKLTSGKYDEISNSKNLYQESLKESSSCEEEEFPKELKSRWKKLEQAGHWGLAKSEKKLFSKLYPVYGQNFFEHCCGVLSYLEKVGNGKSGEEGKIRHPMAYLDGYWARHFEAYQSFLVEECKKKRAEAEADANKKFQADHSKIIAEALDSPALNDQDKLREAEERFVQTFSSEIEQEKAAKELLKSAGKDYYLSYLIKSRSGWRSPSIKPHILALFLDEESQIKLKVKSSLEVA